MYDVLVMGAGPAGIAAAERAARLGAKVCLLDARRAGGTDAVSGVVPARTLAQIAQLKRTADDLGRYGIKVGTPELDFGRALGRCREVIEEVHASKEVLARDLGKGQALDVFECVGEARFVDPQRVVLPNGRVLEADAYILCTGGHPRRPDFPGSALSLVPSDLWQPGAKLPSSAVILGTGHTGVQVASILADFGCKVHLLERGPQILSHEDHDLAEAVRAAFVERGIDVVTGVGDDRSIAKDGDELLFRYTTADGDREIRCEAVVVSLGWTPNTVALGLDVAGVDVDGRGFIQVSDALQTSQPHIFAAGDVTGRRMLVPAAMQEGYVAAGNAVVGTRDPVRHQVVSAGGYPFPEHGSVGLTEAEARRQHEVEVATVPYSENPRAIIDGRTYGFCKLVVDRVTHRILGAHVVGERAVEVVQLVATGMATGLRVEQLAAVDLAYPTYVQIVGEAAYRICLSLGIELHETLVPNTQGAAVASPKIALRGSNMPCFI